MGDPTPGGREALVSPRVGLAAHEAAGGGGGRVREDHRADTMQDPIRVPSVLLAGRPSGLPPLFPVLLSLLARVQTVVRVLVPRGRAESISR